LVNREKFAFAPLVYPPYTIRQGRDFLCVRWILVPSHRCLAGGDGCREGQHTTPAVRPEEHPNPTAEIGWRSDKCGYHQETFNV